MNIDIFPYKSWCDPAYNVCHEVRKQALTLRVVQTFFWMSKKLSMVAVHSLLQSTSCPELSLLSSTFHMFWDYPLWTHEASRLFKKSPTKFLNGIMRPVKNFKRPPDEKSCERGHKLRQNGFYLHKNKQKTNMTNLMLQINENSVRIMSGNLPIWRSELNCNLIE